VIANEVQSICLAMESQQGQALKRDTVHNRSPPCEVTSNHVLQNEREWARVPTRSHTMPISFFTQGRHLYRLHQQKTAACVDRLTMENVIRNAAFRAEENSSANLPQPDANTYSKAHSGCEKAKTYRRKPNYHGQSLNFKRIIPVTADAQDSEQDDPNTDIMSRTDCSKTPSEQDLAVYRESQDSQEGSDKRGKHEAKYLTNSEAPSLGQCSSSVNISSNLKLNYSSSGTPPENSSSHNESQEDRSSCNDRNTWDGDVTMSSIRDGQNKSKHRFHLYVVYAFFGIISWGSSQRARLYKVCIRWASALVIAFCIVDLIQHRNRLYELLAPFALSVGSYASLASMGKLECIIGGSTGFLGQHAIKHKFLLGWSRRGTHKLVLMLLVWICKVGASILKLHVMKDINSVFGLCRCIVSYFKLDCIL